MILVYIFMNLFNYLILMIMVLLSVSFLTLLERKVLGYIQIRKGPNKVSFMGILQPFSDAIKLFNKEFFMVLKSNYLYYYLSPVMMLSLSLLMWMIFPYFTNLIYMNYSLLLLICVLSLGVYLLMYSGWSSNSMYTLLGSLRSISQSISYEVTLILSFIMIFYFIEGFSFMNLLIYQKSNFFIIMMFPLFIILFISMLAELNRTPFDISEGESELVSGFNTEYSSSGFALIFMAEYSNILLMSFIISLMFFSYNLLNGLFYLILLIFSFMIIWIRGVLPRIRYDNLMNLSWKFLLIYLLGYLVFMMMIKLFLI